VIPQTLRSCCDELRAMVIQDNITRHALVQMATRLEQASAELENTTVFEPHVVDLTRAFAVIQGGRP
jgi:hypothetical protein